VRDWSVLVRERFSGRGLTELQQTEIVSELAAHLEDLYEHAHNLGVTEAEAIFRALNEVDNWRELSREISRTKKPEGQMNARTRSLWLPGFTTLTAAMGALMIINRFDLQPKIYWYGSLAVVQMYVPWLAVLPLFGALGAYLSRRADGNLKTRLAAASFPALVLLALLCPGIALAAVLEHHLNWYVLPIAFAVTAFNWVLLPGVLLLLGALPFLPRSAMWATEQGGQLNDRTRRLWLPGFASLTAATGMLIALNRIGVEPRIFWQGTRFGMNLVLPWLIALPVFGGLGAYLSRLANGGLRTRLVAALFPAIVIFGVFCLTIAVSEVMWRVFPIAFAWTVFNWVLIPGAALLLGALPFLRSAQTREVEHVSC
jgi:hypothetical protein